jgi:hypothetical protein
MFALMGPRRPSDEELISSLDAAHARVGREERELLRFIAQVDERDIWLEWGARNTAHWFSMRLGISWWKAQRLIVAAKALGHLPRISDALVSGRLSLDKVTELARFATPENEQKLIGWAEKVSGAAIRHKGDLEARRQLEEDIEAEKSRSVDWWYSDEGHFSLQADLPAAQGATIVRALERMAESIPAMPGEKGGSSAPERRADALVALCSARIASDPDPDRATVIVHAQLEGLSANTGGCEVEDGPVLHPESVRRLLCNARMQTVVEDSGGNVVGLGRMHREPSAWMQRQVRYRDRECRFPGCGARRFTQAHHLRFWSHGGRTELENLLLICSFHHKLVHELGWKVTRARDGTVRWFRPSGAEYRAGPSPGRRMPELAAIRRSLSVVH